MTLAATELTAHNLFETVEGIVAVATIAVATVTAFLAASTFWLARRTAALAASTEREVSALREQIDLSRNEVEAMMAQVEVARQQVETGQQQVAVARAALEATFRPLLIDVPRDWDGFPANVEETIHYVNGPDVLFRPQDRWAVHADESPKHIHLSLPVRNAGAGVAFITGTSLRWYAGNPVSGFPAKVIVPPGESARLMFSVPKVGDVDLDSLFQYGSFSVEVRYRDLGGHSWSSRLDTQKGKSRSAWFVTQTFVKATEADWADAVGTAASYTR